MSKATIDAVGQVWSYYSTPAGTAPLVSALGNDGSAWDAAVLSIQTCVIF